MTTPTDQASTKDPANAQAAAHAPRIATVEGKSDTQEVAVAPHSKRPWVIILSAVVVVAITAATVSFFVYRRNLQTTNDAYVEGRIVRISPRVSGPVLHLYVD